MSTLPAVSPVKLRESCQASSGVMRIRSRFSPGRLRSSKHELRRGRRHSHDSPRGQIDRLEIRPLEPPMLPLPQTGMRGRRFSSAPRRLSLVRLPLQQESAPTRKYSTSIRTVRSASWRGAILPARVVKLHGFERFLDVQLARAAVVVHAIGNVGVSAASQAESIPARWRAPSRHRQRSCRRPRREAYSGCLRAFRREYPSSIWASVAPGLTPAATSAPGSAASAYQHSVLPRGWPYFRAILSSGCTCTLSFSLAKITLISSGESGRWRIRAEQRQYGHFREERAELLARVGPVAIRQSSPVSHTSPMGSPSATRSYHGRRSRNPQTRAVNLGSMRNGAISGTADCREGVIRSISNLFFMLRLPDVPTPLRRGGPPPTL